ncbi:hypothetical protein C8J57DRAFT_1725658 [Mycena rebaudengoi]|nr:hypothetical protein C8J57DRAFT_1725658 [Mycena rebaudengoi]
MYGGWPLSGEIDIMAARGNGPSYPKQGVNYVHSSLNWGPTTFLNAVALTFGSWPWRRGRFDSGLHTYVLEWDEWFLRVYIDAAALHARSHAQQALLGVRRLPERGAEREREHHSGEPVGEWDEGGTV